MPKITVDDGIQINYYLDDYTNPWDEVSETILIHHGSAENAKFFVALAHALSRKYRVVRIDARGRGESSAPPPGSTLSGEPDDGQSVGHRCAKDALILMDQLGIKKVHWFGPASGGVIGVLFATSYPDRVKSFTMFNSPYKFPDRLAVRWAAGEKDVPTAIRKFGMKEWVVRSHQATDILDIQTVKSKMEAWVLDQRQRIPTHAYASVFEWVLAFDTRPYLPKIKAPTLILATKRSFVMSVEEQQFVQKQIPNSKLLVFDEPQIHMTIPERCAETIDNFIKSLG